MLNVQIQTAGLGGDNNRDNEWSFGQVLALGTWVPVLVQFGYLWWEKPTVALSGRLMAPYEVVEVSKETKGFELTRRGNV